MKACKQDDLAADLDVVCDHYKEDFDRNGYTLSSNIRSTHSASETDGSITIVDSKNYLLSLSFFQMSHLSEVKCLSQLLLVMPAKIHRHRDPSVL